MSRIESAGDHDFVDGSRRGGPSRRALLTALAAVGLSTALAPASAQAGSFQVSNCKTVGLNPAANVGYQSARWDLTPGVVDGMASGCTGDGAAMNVWQANRRLYAGEDTINRFSLPPGMSGTTIAAIDIAYQPYQQSPAPTPPSF